MPSLLEQLEQKGLRYDQLNAAEKETFNQWQKSLASNQLTLENVKDYVSKLIEGVERELTDLKETTSLWTFLFGWKKDYYLKARLRNYIMIHDYLSGPEKARKYVEQSIQNINK
jgi:hypothetical protein